VNFKILNEIYPTNEFLRLKFNFEVNNCVFCETNIENLEVITSNVHYVIRLHF